MRQRILGHIFAVLSLLVIMTGSVQGQNEVCHFDKLDADCRYRVDAICLAHITANVDQCSDPVQVTFSVTCENPKVRWSHVYDGKDSSVQVPGFDRDVQLQVKLSWKPDKVLNVEADFHVWGFAKRDFINHDVKLRGLSDKCPLLTKAAAIAISVCGGLLGIILAIVVILCVVRRKINNKNASQATDILVEAAVDPHRSTPRVSRLYEMDIPGSTKLSGDSEKVSDDIRTSPQCNGSTDTNRQISSQHASRTVQNDGATPSTSIKPGHPDVRFSEISKQDNFDDLKASPV